MEWSDTVCGRKANNPVQSDNETDSTRESHVFTDIKVIHACSVSSTGTTERQISVNYVVSQIYKIYQ